MLLHDEMSVRDDLVFDRRGGRIVGFINPQAWTFDEVITYMIDDVLHVLNFTYI